jgi:hypothetical protein
VHVNGILEVRHNIDAMKIAEALLEKGERYQASVYT